MLHTCLLFRLPPLSSSPERNAKVSKITEESEQRPHRVPDEEDACDSVLTRPAPIPATKLA